MIVVLIIVGWIICGVIGAGIYIAYFQREYPSIAKEARKEDMRFGFFWGLLGPVGIIEAFFLSGFCKHGWMLRPPK